MESAVSQKLQVLYYHIIINISCPIQQFFVKDSPREKRKGKQKNTGSVFRKAMSNLQRKRSSSGKNLVKEMLANQEAPIHLILNEEGEAASTVVVPSSTPKKKVTKIKRVVEKEKKVRGKEREQLKML